MMKIFTVVGARPQFIKASPVSQALRLAGHREFLLHTGQHYDYGMSQVFFDEMGISMPDVNLEIGSGSHGQQTARMLSAIEQHIIEQKPDWVVVYGDTNSTLAAALAACKLRVPIAHIEAGLRSFNRDMPEEHNRVLTDHCADLLLCPTQTAVDHLAREAITQGVHLVGDTMYDAVLQFAEVARRQSTVLQAHGLRAKEYLLATIHRPYNTDNPTELRNILHAFAEIQETIVFPVHPRTRKKLDELGFMNSTATSNLKLIEPVGYLDMLMLEQQARLILTDSGGIQKEAFFFGVPCVTLRPETEWVETVELGWNVLTSSNTQQIVDAVTKHQWPTTQPAPVFGDGNAANRIVDLLR
jgi:UDP-N-acetylglucosamine 2-epimerase